MKRQVLLCTLCALSASSLMADMPWIAGKTRKVESSDHMRSNDRVESCRHNDRTQRITFKHREANGIGYPTGYSSVEGFFSTSKTPNLLGFADVRAHVFNDSKKAYNLGVGIRGLSEQAHVVFGANVFYDYRDGRHRAFNQIGVGLEVLGTRWDLRASGYIPVHHIKKKYRDEFLKFKGNSAVFSKRYEFAFIGAELALGRELFRSRYWDLHAKLAGYWFNGEYGKNAGGGLFELSTNIMRYLTLKGQVSYDSLFRDVYQGEAAVNIPFGWRFKNRDCNLSCSVLKMLEDRLVETVDRFEIIVTSTKRKKAVALDPMTGDPLTFIFVNNTSHSLGTFESPYPTLAQAQNASAPDNVIYVFPGDGTTNGMNAGITLKNNQKLIGSSAPMEVTTAFGVRTIPGQTLTAPSISNSGVGVTLANNNQVSGLNILSTGNDGIHGANITGALITRNNINATVGGDGISLSPFTGTVVIANNTISANNNIAAINVSSTAGASRLIIADNTIASGLPTAITGNFSATSPVSDFVVVAGNTFAPGSTSAVAITVGNNVMLRGVIANNIITGTTGASIDLEASGSGAFAWNVSKNKIDQSGTEAIAILPNNSSSTTSSVNIFENLITNANMGGGGQPGVLITPQGSSILQARLVGNSSTALSGAFGYSLSKSGGASLSVQTPNVDNPQAGLQAINIGTFNPASFTDGVTFVPLTY